MASSSGGGENIGSTIDVSKKQADLIRRRAEFRNALKAEFRKQVEHPYRLERGTIFDPQYYRFQAYRAWPYEYAQMKASGVLKYFAFVIFPIAGLGIWFTKRKAAHDAEIRCGEIPYEKRNKIIMAGWIHNLQ